MKDLVTALQVYSDRVQEEVEQGVSETALILDTEASSRAPVDEGNLKNSIQSDIGGLEATVSVGAFYAPFVEYGTGIHATGPGGSRAKQIPWTYKASNGQFYTTYGNPAQPFWFPSIDVARKYFRNYFS